MIDTKTLTLEEKLKTMEMLWDDLCHESEIESPDWHGDVLRERTQQIKEGSAQYVDWEQAKENIKNRTKP